MVGKAWILFLLAMALPDLNLSISVRNVDAERDGRVIGRPAPGSNRCAARIESRIESMKKQQQHQNGPDPSAPLLDLAGYALHQPLRSAPYDMYVTNMRVHVPSYSGWYRIERCFYDPRNVSVEARLTFRDLKVTGMVKLYDEKAVLQDPLLPLPVETCNMTVRLRRAGLGVSALPIHLSRGSVELRTAAEFVKPDFVSVYAFGCTSLSREHRTKGRHNQIPEADFTQEMEDVFVRGIQSLLTKYMEKQLQPALKDTLMANMGYTISYGR